MGIAKVKGQQLPKFMKLRVACEATKGNWQNLNPQVVLEALDSKNQCLEALDLLSLALTEHNHQWTNEQRRAYEKAIKVEY